MKNYLLVLLTIFTSLSYSQYDIKIKVELDTISNVLKIDQEIQINQSKKKQDLLFLLDWNNSFFSKDTPLAKSFTDEYIKNLEVSFELNELYLMTPIRRIIEAVKFLHKS